MDIIFFRPVYDHMVLYVNSDYILLSAGRFNKSDILFMFNPNINCPSNFHPAM